MQQIRHAVGSSVLRRQRAVQLPSNGRPTGRSYFPLNEAAFEEPLVPSFLFLWSSVRTEGASTFPSSSRSSAPHRLAFSVASSSTSFRRPTKRVCSAPLTLSHFRSSSPTLRSRHRGLQQSCSLPSSATHCSLTMTTKSQAPRHSLPPKVSRRISSSPCLRLSHGQS